MSIEKLRSNPIHFEKWIDELEKTSLQEMFRKRIDVISDLYKDDFKGLVRAFCELELDLLHTIEINRVASDRVKALVDYAPLPEEFDVGFIAFKTNPFNYNSNIYHQRLKLLTDFRTLLVAHQYDSELRQVPTYEQINEHNQESLKGDE